MRNTSVFRDVVFQDVGFRTTMFDPLTHISFRCFVFGNYVFQQSMAVAKDGATV